MTIRLGCVESDFILKYGFNFDLQSHLKSDNDIDKYMRKHAGLYYKNYQLKNKICNWWCKETIQLINTAILTSCYNVLNFDLTLWAFLNIRKKFHNYSHIYKIILKYSEGKKILYIGNGVDSIKKSYQDGLQSKWKFKVSNFYMYYLKTPKLQKDVNIHIII